VGRDIGEQSFSTHVPAASLRPFVAGATGDGNPCIRAW
jgi:hypothetical protein